MDKLLSDLFFKQKQSIAHFFENLDLKQAEKALEMALGCQGSLVFTGIGKSGYIAEKLATTLISTGTKAFFLPPTNALHGDLGVVGKGDIFIFLSKSGESHELIDLVPYVRNRGAKTMAWVSRENCRLLNEVDLGVVLPLDSELCPFGLSPTTSSILQLIFGDVLAVALMRKKDFSLAQYALNHPAGAIGRQLTLMVADLMTSGSELPLCGPNDRLSDALVELTNKRCGCLLIVDENENLHGIFTDGDLRRKLQQKGGAFMDERMGDLMTSTFKSIDRGSLAVEALRFMEKDPKKRVMMLPVLDGQRLVGLIHLHDILQAGLSLDIGQEEIIARSL